MKFDVDGSEYMRLMRIRTPVTEPKQPRQVNALPDAVLEHPCYKCDYGTYTGVSVVCGYGAGCVKGLELEGKEGAI